MRYNYIIALYIFISFNYLKGQQNSHIGFGLQYGRSSTFGDGGIILSYIYKKKLDISSGLGVSKYRSICYGFDINYSFFYKNKKICPILGLSYNLNPKNTISEGPDDNHIGTYFVSKQNFLIPSIGIRKDIFNKNENGFLSFRFSATYRLPEFSNEVQFLKGIQSVDFQNNIDKRVNERFGVTARLILTIGL